MTDEPVQPAAEGLDPDMLGAVSFVGTALSPLFTEDPKLGKGAGVIGAFAQLDVDAAAADWPFVDPQAAKDALALMKQGAQPQDDGRPVDPLTAEYRRLFVGPAAKACPPWGSVYTDKDMVIFGESTLALRSWMRANGIARQDDEKTPEDHIGLLLAMLPYLAQHKPELVVEFLRDHVLTWSSHFLDLMAQQARHPFYQGLAAITKASLEGMQAKLGIKVVYPKYFR